MDISTTDRTKFEVFEKLLKSGPNTVYGLYIALGKESWSQTTVHRIVKFLEQEKSIEIYSEETKTGRSGKVYGITIHGLFWMATQEKSLLDEADDIFGKWLDEPKFSQAEEIVSLFGAEMLENDPAKAKELFKRLCAYSVGMIEAWKAYEPNMTLVDEMFFGELIAMGTDEKWLQSQKEFYNELPGFRATIEAKKKQQAQLLDYLEQ